MNQLWRDELTEDEADLLIAKASQEIRKRKMEVPAILFLEMHKPLGYIASQAMITFAPFLVPFIGFDNLNNWSRLAANRRNIERLIDQIAQPQMESLTPMESAT